MFGTIAFSALMKNVETLEALRIESAEELEMNAFVDVLCSARNLRRLEGIADGQKKRFGTEILVLAYETYFGHVEGGVGRLWVLGPSMEHLQLQIEGVPRPDALYRHNGEEQPTQELGLDPFLTFHVQRWIYTQLRRMAEQEEPILGLQDLSTSTMEYAGVDSSMSLAAMEEAALLKDTRMFNYQSQEFSLESGLCLLAEPKELRMLDVRSTAQYIGVAELEWMHRNWPKLDGIKGLDSDRRWTVYHADGPAAKTAVEKCMAAHPHVIGSSFYSSP
ncbi:hypothetical protein BGX30_013697 [Mortierella sp. GBA39]|nr:hypothetical protein BGX30_013697 [Mortierella sp. GBA39]